MSRAGNAEVGRCWMCGGIACTGEHKIKRSDLERVHGKGIGFKAANLNYITGQSTAVGGRRVVPLQGPDSKYIKYLNILCGSCNSAVSQPFDRAYDEFIQYVEDHSDELLQNKMIDFCEIYGSDWFVRQVDLFKYFIKALGCRIAHAGKPVPRDLFRVINGLSQESRLAICFDVDEDEIKKPPNLRTRLGIGSLIHTEGEGAEERYAFASRYRWLFVSYWYNIGPYGVGGDLWCETKRHLRLGSYTGGNLNLKICRDDGSQVSWVGFEDGCV